jgi:hypothetical protein
MPTTPTVLNQPKQSERTKEMKKSREYTEKTVIKAMQRRNRKGRDAQRSKGQHEKNSLIMKNGSKDSRKIKGCQEKKRGMETQRMAKSSRVKGPGRARD